MTGNAQDFFRFPEADSLRKPHIEVATALALGQGNVLDTYLSPQKYRGIELRFVSEVKRESRKRNMAYLLTHEGALSYTGNTAGNANNISGHYDFAYAAMYRWRLLDDHLRIYAGGMADMNIGFGYCTRNSSNNPAQGYISLGIGPQIMAHYDFHLWKKDFRLTYETRTPWIGLMFSPNYGQSYYEIFGMGNYDSNIVFTSLETFQMRQQITLDMPVGRRTAIRIGYLSDIRQATPNNLKQHHWYNAGMIGVVINKF